MLKLAFLTTACLRSEVGFKSTEQIRLVLGCGSLVECLPGMHRALDLIPSTTGEKKPGCMYIYVCWFHISIHIGECLKDCHLPQPFSKWAAWGAGTCRQLIVGQSLSVSSYWQRHQQQSVPFPCTPEWTCSSAQLQEAPRFLCVFSWETTRMVFSSLCWHDRPDPLEQHKCICTKGGLKWDRTRLRENRQELISKVVGKAGSRKNGFLLGGHRAHRKIPGMLRKLLGLAKTIPELFSPSKNSFWWLWIIKWCVISQGLCTIRYEHGWG